MVLDRIADRAGWSGRARNRDAVGGRRRALPRARRAAGEAADVHERVGARGPQDRSRASGRRSARCSSSSTTSRCRSASCGSARAAARAATTGCARSSASSGRRRSAGCGSGSASPDRGFADHVLSKFEPDERQRLDELLDAAADAVEAWAREGTNKAANRFNPFELRPADEDRLAPAGRGRRAARAGRHPADEDRLAARALAGPRRRRAADREASRSEQPARRCAGGAAGSAGSPSSDAAGRADRRRAARALDSRRRPRSRPTPTVAARAQTAADPKRQGPGRRIPNLGGLPRLLDGTGGFGALRERLGPTGCAAHRARAGTPASPRCRTARRATSRRRSRSWRASGSAGSRATRRSAIGSPRSWRPGSAIRVPWRCWSRGRRWPTSGASSSPTRRRRGSRRCRRGGAAARGSSWRASRR